MDGEAADKVWEGEYRVGAGIGVSEGIERGDGVGEGELVEVEGR